MFQHMPMLPHIHPMTSSPYQRPLYAFGPPWPTSARSRRCVPKTPAAVIEFDGVEPAQLHDAARHHLASSGARDRRSGSVRRETKVVRDRRRSPFSPMALLHLLPKKDSRILLAIWRDLLVKDPNPFMPHLLVRSQTPPSSDAVRFSGSCSFPSLVPCSPTAMARALRGRATSRALHSSGRSRTVGP